MGQGGEVRGDQAGVTTVHSITAAKRMRRPPGLHVWDSRPMAARGCRLADDFARRKEHGGKGRRRSDNGPEFVAKAVQEWIAGVGAKTAYIERGSPWENGYIESFNARLRDELLDGEIFYTLREAQIVIESWRRHYNTIRPHASLGYKPPAPEVFVPAFAAWPAALRRPASPATLAQPPTLN